MVGTVRARLEKLRSNRFYASWLKGMGVDTDALDPVQADRIISNMRTDSLAAEEYFSELLDQRVDKLRAPIVSVVGSQDPVTDYYTERYREWEFLTDSTALVVLDQAGHYFLRYRAEELAEIVTQVHPAVESGDTGPLHVSTRGLDALVSPLVLAFGSVTDVAKVAIAEAVGAVVGGVLMALWGGPRKRRMIGVLFGNVGIAAGCLVMGLRPSLTVVAVGLFLMAAAMSVSQGIYATLIQVKVPQRFHGRVFAINQTITWSTLPIGFAVLAPLAVRWFEPLLARDGALAGSVGAVIGAGPGRGVALAYLVFALILLAINLGGFAVRLLRRFDTEVPDSLPDDLVGAQERERRRAERAGQAERRDTAA